MKRKRQVRIFARLCAAGAIAVLGATTIKSAVAEPLHTGWHGWIASPVVSGYGRLQTPSTVSVRVPLYAPYTTKLTLRVQSSSQRCNRSMWIPAGRKTYWISCQFAAQANGIPWLPVTVTAAVERQVGKVTQRAQRTRNAWLPLGEGMPLANAAALGEWQRIGQYLDTVMMQRNLTVAKTYSLSAQQSSSRQWGLWNDLAAWQPPRPPAGVRRVSGIDAAEAANAVVNEVAANGWNSARVPGLLQTMLDTVNPDGGYGLSFAWDAYQDGSVNPQTTSYSITTAGQVGWVLLNAYRNGKIGIEPLQRAVDSVLATPRTNAGSCIGYSTSVFDATKPCVYNVSFAVAVWLDAVKQTIAYRSAEIEPLLAAVRARLRDGYNATTGYWVYMTGNKYPQDIDHQMVTARAAELLDPSFKAIDVMMRKPWWQQPNGTGQRKYFVATAMGSVSAYRCSYAGLPGVIAGIHRGIADSTISNSSLLALRSHVTTVTRSCFG